MHRIAPVTWPLEISLDFVYCGILKALGDGRLAENTIVVVMSDHGEMAGAHGGMIQKFHNAYEEVI